MFTSFTDHIAIEVNKKYFFIYLNVTSRCDKIKSSLVCLENELLLDHE